MGRQIRVTGPDPDGAGPLAAPVTESEYNVAGQLIRSTDAGGHVTEYVYDELGRLVTQTDALGGETSFTYDAAGNRLSLTDPEQNTTSWTYDNLGRMTEETNPLDDARQFTYNAAGLLIRRVDRRGWVRQFTFDNLYRNTAEIWYDSTTDDFQTDTTYDDLGRVLKTIENYTDGDPTTGNADEDVTVSTTYTADGQVATYTAHNPDTGNQVTTYVYGSWVGGLTPEVYRSDLLRAVIYPDSDDTGATGVPPVLTDGTDGVYDRVEYQYNRLGQTTWTKDQNETVHQYEFDHLGRQTADKATTLGTNIDGSVRRIERSYEVRGMVASIISYDATSGGNAVNQIQREYDDFGLLTREYQEHDGLKDVSGRVKPARGEAR